MSDDYFKPRKPLADKLARIPQDTQPTAPIPPTVDDLATRHGFVSREQDAIQPRQTLGPTVMLTARAPIRVAARFRRFCDANRYAYWEAIEALMDKSGVD